jgi:predicted O-methyltransferase YrrM
MVSGAQQGRLLHMLVRLSRASRVLEVGCFSGYAAMWMGLALPAGGKLLSLERDERAAAVARAHLASAGLSDRVEVRLGDAMDALGALPGPFELIVISAEALQVVPSAEAAMRCALANLASHGLVIVVAQPATVSEDPTIHEHARQEDARQEDAPRGALVPMLLSLARQVEPAAHAVTLPSPDGDGGVLTLIGRTLEM